LVFCIIVFLKKYKEIFLKKSTKNKDKNLKNNINRPVINIQKVKIKK
jgi:hypothetical protein